MGKDLDRDLEQLRHRTTYGLGVLLKNQQIVKHDLERTSARTRTSSEQFLSGPARGRRSTRRARSPSASAPAGAGIGGVLHADRATARWSPTARRTRPFDGRMVRARARADRRTTRWSRRGRATRRGTSIFRKTAQQLQLESWRPPGKITIAEVEELLPAGAIDPDEVHTPGIFVQRIIKGPSYDKPIEFRTTRAS